MNNILDKNIEKQLVLATCKNAANSVSDIMEQDCLVNKFGSTVSVSFQKVYSDFIPALRGQESLQETISQTIDSAFKNFVEKQGQTIYFQSTGIADMLLQSGKSLFSRTPDLTNWTSNPLIKQKMEDFFLSLKAEVLKSINVSEWNIKLSDMISYNLVEESKNFINKEMEPRGFLCQELSISGNKIQSAVNERSKIFSFGERKRKITNTALVKDMMRMSGEQISVFTKLFNN